MSARESIRLVFLLEEQSAMYFLKALLPEILPAHVDLEFIPHQGKSDLQRSIKKGVLKLKKWHNLPSFFVILHDQDSHDCIALKKDLRDLCNRTRVAHQPLIRIACRELEAWYFGDLDAVESVFPNFRADRHKNKAKYRNPDQIHKPSKVLQKIVKGFRKSDAAKRIPHYMNLANNKSASFNAMLEGVTKFANDCLHACKP
ncbi:MAG: DUF4276 family protein [Alphaproteobacteria bacterium]|nr:DUF4276 family protein [Alphaproteobacteria bacterium]MDA8001800.1 DUF4276 family protein [Alphaproteobacteria bacterium]MDA8009452.1 DUF4276 family protein [Alphaproteobacteria bacterium]MDA8030238.1 DUF4276 family protein [Alphaproteobacteria bacterium]